MDWQLPSDLSANDARPRVIELERKYLSRYRLLDECAMEAGKSTRERGWMEFDEFIAIATWKLASSGSTAFERATPAEVKERTLQACTTWRERRDSVAALDHLVLLPGVKFRTATAMMHVAFIDEIPILDRRVLRSLGVETSKLKWLCNVDKRIREVYPSFAKFVCQQAKQICVGLRTLDRALWQLDRERDLLG